LEALVLHQNKFVGQIPTDIGRMTSLATLNLMDNTFTGTFPWESFGNQEDCVLAHLNLASNSFTGSIPWDILSANTKVGWTCLQALVLMSSGFSSESLPDTAFDNWENTLMYLDLSDTFMQGSIPTTISGLSTLVWLDLGRNFLTGTLPQAITELETLRTLYLDFNSLEGPIPSKLGMLPHLLAIDMRGNRLNKTIPALLGNLRSLEYLHLEQNELTGTVPASLSKLKNLTSFVVSGNQLSGSMEVFCSSGQHFKNLASDCLTMVACSCCTNCDA
jgi:Leucine-rich repeat (LRR) protein